MIKLVTACSLLLLSTLNADSIDDMISKINSKREAKIPKNKLVSIQSPMPKLIVVDTNGTDKNKTILKPKDETFDLTAIVNNSAYINGKWVKKGENIGSYKLMDIMDDSVYLKDGKKTKLIFFKQNSAKIKIRLGR